MDVCRHGARKPESCNLILVSDSKGDSASGEPSARTSCARRTPGHPLAVSKALVSCCRSTSRSRNAASTAMIASNRSHRPRSTSVRASVVSGTPNHDATSEVDTVAPTEGTAARPPRAALVVAITSTSVGVATVGSPCRIAALRPRTTADGPRKAAAAHASAWSVRGSAGGAIGAIAPCPAIVQRPRRTWVRARWREIPTASRSAGPRQIRARPRAPRPDRRSEPVHSRSCATARPGRRAALACPTLELRGRGRCRSISQDQVQRSRQ